MQFLIIGHQCVEDVVAELGDSWRDVGSLSLG
jgi:hypothetical protein